MASLWPWKRDIRSQDRHSYRYLLLVLLQSDAMEVETRLLFVKSDGRASRPELKKLRWFQDAVHGSFFRSECHNERWGQGLD